MNLRACALPAFALVALAACGGGGRFGYAREYTFYGNEAQYARRANDALYDEVRRMPDRYNNQLIAWFGVVNGVQPAPNGDTRISMQLRTHQERHLCMDETEGSCRVTVSETDGGAFTAVVHLAPDDASGENRVQVGSLLKVYGTLVQGEYDAQGGPVLHAQFYRHWPHGQYVTTAARESYRR